ncbi:MAG: hypothetical protein KGN02_11050 [bacterium]|nr:hypothetical protein [bacterium]
MIASGRLPRTIIGGVILAVACAFGCVQLASDSLYASVAVPGSVPTRVPVAFGLRVYELLDRIAPAQYVEDTLGNAALARGDAPLAQRYALRMEPGARRDDLLGRIALARGEDTLAREYLFVAPDVDLMQQQVRALALRDPRAAYALELRFVAHLAALGTHPDAVADGYWIAGLIAETMGHHADALRAYRTAMTLAPLDMKYVLAAANQAFSMHEDAIATPIYRHGLDVDPGSADVLGGLGIMALHRGDRASALRYAARARAIDPHSGMLLELERELR